jgi:proline iminopeptidase
MNRGTRHSALGTRLLAAGCLALTFACGQPQTSSGPAAADSGHVATPGARIFWKSLGRGHPIIVVHGGPGMDHTYLVPGMNELARTHRVVYYDQRGGGRTEGAASRETVSLDLFMSDITALADSLRLGKFTVLGHSFGGLVALHYAARHPDRLRALVLMNTVEPGRKYTAQMNDLTLRKRTPQDSAQMQELMRSEAMRLRDTSAVNAMLRLAFQSLFVDRALARALHLSLDPRTVANMAPVAMNLIGSMGPYDFWPVAARIRVPTLILQGVEDAMPLEMLRELQGAIPGSELVLVERAGHFPYIEQPDATFTAIRRFLTARATN